MESGWCLPIAESPDLYMTIITKLITNTLPVVDLGKDTTININDTIILDAGSGYIKYIWSNGSEEQTITLFSLSAGDNEYSVNVTSIDNCDDSDTIVIHVIIPNSLPILFNSFELEIFPNPISDFLFIKSNANIASEFFVILIDNMGRTVFERRIAELKSNEEITLNLTNLNNGLYILRIYNNEIVLNHKIIKY